MNVRTYPLGIDLGTSRIRIARVERRPDGPFLREVVTIDLEPGLGVADVAARLRATLVEREIVERRCIASVGEPDAQLHAVAFPPMNARERERAARFEAARYVDYPPAEAVVRTIPLPGPGGMHLIGITRAGRLERTLAILRGAKLRPLTVDHEAFAYRRAFPYAQVVVDVGASATRFYAYGEGAPICMTIAGGAQTFTTAIAQALGIDAATAERRKRTIGLSGAGETELTAFAQSVGRALLAARNRGMIDAQRIVLVGNGARLSGLADRLERDTGCSADVATDLGIERSAYPEDIARASAPDFAHAAGLARWSFSEDVAA